MKKLLILCVISIAIGNMVNAQSCKCNPNGFNPFVYSYLGETLTVKDGHQFSVKCKSPIKLDGGYKCSYTTPCDVKLKAVLKNAAGVVIRTYAEFNFPFEHSFEAAGNYVLEIVPWCGGKICTSAKFYFTVSCDAPLACACDVKNRWDKFTSYINNKATVVKCGYQFSLKKEQQFGLEGGYKCEGDCTTKFIGKLTNTATGETLDIANFQFNWLHKFEKAGNYKLVITPTCGGKECTPCIFYFTVR